ncbi:DegT/DnrJ/EryC1/StrS family aminotransferase [Paralcaligenes ureilyticus]|uniref:dTDP-4-amino-4,6-dideoxygalactose transaminase n=1 Tax=Paralcaligenes ureilyticus TaxID=627131 RepID=A0A4R3LRR5_9BURK|nr:aminotransferase class I/II-fold pyridoxal phosphate-dependent enzyme [Paralcaligenes ureilyticus]TCT03100.1 dTDP-4-amino-4,6-dideoxygalactose transaminase [Paralcaligenes ureilyticus]
MPESLEIAVESFDKSFTQQEPIPEVGIARAIEIMRGGRLHRYNVNQGETSETTTLENKFANYLGVDYCLACASGGYAMLTALRAFGLWAGESVLTNALTLSPVPGAIHAAGGKAVLVETTDQLVLDLDDLHRKLGETSSRLLLISHMRGHIVDMDALLTILDRHGASLIEDCAHTMGAFWGGRPSGTFGIAACFSTQTYKHINSGEGGFLTSNDRDLMARAVILSGSYMLYDQHTAGPAPEAYADIRLDTPNCSGRMDNLRAAILLPQLSCLDDRVCRWNERYHAIESELGNVDGLKMPLRPPQEQFVGSSIQFLVPGISTSQANALLATCKKRGVDLKWFGAVEPRGYTSHYSSWRYLSTQTLPQTDRVLHGLFDMRIPLTFSIDDCHLVGRIIRESFNVSLSL